MFLTVWAANSKSLKLRLRCRTSLAADFRLLSVVINMSTDIIYVLILLVSYFALRPLLGLLSL